MPKHNVEHEFVPFEESFCPMTEKNCRKDCDWLHELITLSDDGIDTERTCAVNVIANYLTDQMGYEDE